MMIKKIFGKLIRGVPEGVTTSARMPAVNVSRDLYRHESDLSEAEISGGVGEDGSVWEIWRADVSGIWFRRISEN